MTRNPLSLILLPTLACNAACRYCFEHKNETTLDHARLSIVLDKVLDYMDERKVQTLLIYWQGGEIMTLPASWFEEARAIIEQAAQSRGKEICNYAQSNMIGYTGDWEQPLLSFFDGSVGTSMDYPNIHRIPVGGTTSEYDSLWRQNVAKARDAGIHVGVISIPNPETLRVGAERFYSHFVDDLRVTDFQINLPFPGGPGNDPALGYPLETEALGRFLSDLFDIWIDKGYDQGVTVGPFDRLLDHHLEGGAPLPCIWRDNCSNKFLCIDPTGNVAQCDCWVASYPEHWFGIILEPGSLSHLLKNSTAHRAFRQRPSILIQQEDCLDCEYLPLCHGGCPVRAYSVWGSIFRKDPYCEVYKRMFRLASDAALKISYRRSRRTPDHGGEIRPGAE